MPTIICEINPSDSSLTKKYYYTNAQILAQDDESASERYFYLHDRLGSVRMVLDGVDTTGDGLEDTAAVCNTYTYNPFGEDITSECTDPSAQSYVENPWKYTGQYHDKKINQDYLRARQYDPQTARFTGRDPIKGAFTKPMTLNPYLYCLNDPVDNYDPTGKFTWEGNAQYYRHFDAEDTQQVLAAATELVGEWWNGGALRAFTRGGVDGLGIYDMLNSHCSFTLNDPVLGNIELWDTAFGNYLLTSQRL